jgi:hypothetical protein
MEIHQLHKTFIRADKAMESHVTGTYQVKIVKLTVSAHTYTSHPNN